MFRIGLLMLEQLHCGIDVSNKIAVDQTVLEGEQQRARQGFEENMTTVRCAASRPQPIIVQVPQAAPEPALPEAASHQTSLLRISASISGR
jgi:hypothetical protein